MGAFDRDTPAVFRPLDAEKLEKTNIIQETGKDIRTIKTEERVKLLNSLYDMLLQFSEAAKIIFAKNPLKRERYILPHNNSIGNDNETPGEA